MTWQLALTTLSTIIASGILIRLVTVQAEVRKIKAEARKSEQEAANLAFERMKETAEYYRARWNECEGRKTPPPPTRQAQKGRL